MSKFLLTEFGGFLVYVANPLTHKDEKKSVPISFMLNRRLTGLKLVKKILDIELSKGDVYTRLKIRGQVKGIERFHSRDYRPYWFTETKEIICIKIEFNSQRFSLGHQHGRCDVM